MQPPHNTVWERLDGRERLSCHEYRPYGGLVVGEQNQITAPAATVSGGAGNRATGRRASVSGLGLHEASGETSTVSGELANHATGSSAGVSGGFHAASVA